MCVSTKLGAVSFMRRANVAQTDQFVFVPADTPSKFVQEDHAAIMEPDRAVKVRGDQLSDCSAFDQLS